MSDITAARVREIVALLITPTACDEQDGTFDIGAHMQKTVAMLEMSEPDNLNRIAKALDLYEGVEAVRFAAGPAAWLDRWAVHVGNCEGDHYCTCGLAVARYEAAALAALVGEVK
jgi:hypothetical protein